MIDTDGEFSELRIQDGVIKSTRVTIDKSLI
jgi:hypothetical protein